MLWTIDHASRSSLQEQIAGCVRRGVADGQLAVGERLPPAQELADALEVDRNTVLAAYRQLRDSGVLEFRRGRGARIAETAQTRSELDQTARELVELGRQHGYGRADLIRIIEELT
jgi:GntR family transcriptional regulator